MRSGTDPGQLDDAHSCKWSGHVAEPTDERQL